MIELIPMPSKFFVSGFVRALFQFGQGAAGQAAKFGRGGVQFLGVIGATCLECDKPAAKPRELVRLQFGDGFGDFFDFHADTILAANPPASPAAG